MIYRGPHTKLNRFITILDDEKGGPYQCTATLVATPPETTVLPTEVLKPQGGQGGIVLAPIKGRSGSSSLSP